MRTLVNDLRAQLDQIALGAQVIHQRRMAAALARKSAERALSWVSRMVML
jgi:hypothetical protein